MQPYIHQSRCLDVFAGSGVLGFEALSRGSSEVVFIENNKKTASGLNENICALDAKNTTVIQQDALVWLQSVHKNKQFRERFDLVFLDPPFHAELLTKSGALLNSSGCLAEDAIIYIEHNIDEDIAIPDNWVNLKEKKAGQVAYKLFESRADSEA